MNGFLGRGQRLGPYRLVRPLGRGQQDRAKARPAVISAYRERAQQHIGTESLNAYAPCNSSVSIHCHQVMALAPGADAFGGELVAPEDPAISAPLGAPRPAYGPAIL